MKKNDIIQLDVIDAGANGEGIAKVDNFVIFVPFALQGEKILAKLLKVNKNFAYAKIEKIITPSPERVEPRCPVFGKCGGCNLQHTTYENQLKIKKIIVQNTLRKMLHTPFEVQDTIGSCLQYGYRNKMQFPINKDGIGMYAQNSHRLIPLTDCPISQQINSKLISLMQQYINRSGISLYNEETGQGILRNVLVRVKSDSYMITIVCNGEPTKIQILVDLLSNNIENFGLYYNINKKRNNTILTDEFVHVAGIKEQECTDFGINYTLLPLSFAQVNDCIQNEIYQKILSIVGNNIVIDAYSGAGLLSAIISTKAKHVYGIEIIQQATDNANALKEKNNIQNLTNINGDCAIELPKLISTLQDPIVVLDPPRKGCDIRVLEALIQNAPSKIIYVSCNPASLARDLQTLEQYYDITLVQPYDMFPQTKHVETLVVLEIKSL